MALLFRAAWERGDATILRAVPGSGAAPRPPARFRPERRPDGPGPRPRVQNSTDPVHWGAPTRTRVTPAPGPVEFCTGSGAGRTDRLPGRQGGAACG
ncbi:hypothetical protein GCM10027411_24600 [Microbacterium aureliae]